MPKDGCACDTRIVTNFANQELIQNAEDAGARDVKFLYDKTQHGTDTLYHKGLRHFQVFK